MSKGYLQDDDGNFSIMRVAIILIVVSGVLCFIAEVVYMMYNPNYAHHLWEITGFVSVGVGGKVTQKITEKSKSK